MIMEKQRIFRSGYARQLKEGVKTGINLHRYESENFEYDEEQTLFFPNIDKPVGLLDALDDTDDFKSAVKIYEAYSGLEPIQASDIRFWVYLAHADLYPYVKERWNSEISSKYILDHWFIETPRQGNFLRHSISQLWWAVHLSIDKERSNKYELTKILFRNRDFPFRTLGTYRLGRHKEAVIGILEFIVDSKPLFVNKFEDKTRYLTKYLNQLGGVKPIAYYNREFFTSALTGISSIISKI